MTQTIPPLPDDAHIILVRLESRLRIGWELIERRREAGVETDALEAFWRDLLQQYTDLLKAQP